LSNDQRPKKMAVYSGDAPKAPTKDAADSVAARTGASAGDVADAAASTDAVDAAATQAGASSGLPVWAILLYLVAGTGAGGALVALLPRYAPQLLHAA
jgi:hypothetical protein